MAYSLEIAATARKQLDRLPKGVQRRIAVAIDALSDTPRPPGSRKLRGAEDLWRIRIGSYRVIYRIEDARLVVLILKIGHRKGVYRG